MIVPIDYANAARAAAWEQQLPELLTRWSASEYSMHRASCLHFARDVIVTLCGGEPLDALAVTLAEVTSPLGAARLLHRYGTADAIITAVLGAPIAPLHARRGDLAAVPVEGALAGHGDWSIGVVDGTLIHLTAHDGGLAVLPLTDARHCWRVGE